MTNKESSAKKSQGSTKKTSREANSAKKLKKGAEASDSALSDGTTTATSEAESSDESLSENSVVSAKDKGGARARRKSLVPRYTMAVKEEEDKVVGSELFDAVEAHIAMFWSEKKKHAASREKRARSADEGSATKSKKRSKK